MNKSKAGLGLIGLLATGWLYAQFQSIPDVVKTEKPNLEEGIIEETPNSIWVNQFSETKKR